MSHKFKKQKVLLKIAKYFVAACLSVPVAYGLWLMTRMLLLDYFTIPTESMYPTLKPGDKVVVNKITLGARIYTDLNFNTEGQELKSFRLKGSNSIKHNDIVVFNLANHWGKINFIINNVFCKRCIGLPGDSVSTKNGHYVNNNFDGALCIEEAQDQLEHIPDSLIKAGYWIPPYCNGWNIKNFGPMYIPRKGDLIKVNVLEAAIYKVMLEWELDKEITWNWDKNEAYANGKRLTHHRWQHNYYFMAGDNVIDSNDSRYWGVVPEEYIVGVVDIIIRNGKIIQAK